MASNYNFNGPIPLGVNVEDNVNRALAYKATHTSDETVAWFFNVVKNNSDGHLPLWESMDYKQINPIYAPFGNFNYAVVGKAVGFPDFLLKLGAGAAQIVSDFSTPEKPISFKEGALIGLTKPNFGDNPEDQLQIQDGINAYDSGNINQGFKFIEDLPLNGEISAWLDLAFGSNFLGSTNPSLINNALLDIQTDTELVPGFQKAVDENNFANSVNLGFAFDTGVSSAGLLSTTLNGSGFWNTALSDIVTDGIRPGNFNVSAENHLWNTLNNTFLAGSNFQSFSTTTGAGLNDLTLGAINSSFVDPLVLDLNGNGVHLTDFASNPVLFDIDNDGGSKELTGWVSAADGILVQDLNGNGKIDNSRETFSEYFNGTTGTGGNAGSKPYKNGLVALKSQDSNGDNKFTVADANWANVRVWVDANHNGSTDSGELKTLAALGISQINLNAKTQSGLIKDGNEVLASGSFVQNGVTKQALALNFLADPNGHAFVTSGTGTKITTQGDVSSYVSNSSTGETINVTLDVQVFISR